MKKKLLFLFLTITLVAAGTPLGFAVSYPSDQLQAEADAAVVGEFLGRLYGKNDYNDDKANSWNSAIPSNEEITAMFNLSRETTAYRSRFISQFRTSFQYGYQRGYRESAVDIALMEPDNTGLADGFAIGEMAGTLQGRLDYAQGLNSDWTRSLPSNTQIISDFRLAREVASYQGGFIDGFIEAYQTYYILSFREVNLETLHNRLAQNQPTYLTVNLLGGQLESADGLMKVIFPQGSVFRDSRVGLTRGPMQGIDPQRQLTAASELYTVEAYDALLPISGIQLSFTYYGPQEGVGIFEYRNNTWKALPSRLEGNQLTAVIQSPVYRGGQYGVLYQRNYVPLPDIEDHWAYEALSAFHFAGYITGSPAYGPDQPIKRGEFVALLDLVYDWAGTPAASVYNYRDWQLLGSYETAFRRAISRGIISGYQDQTLRPTLPLSYTEAQWIMGRVLSNPGFQWSTFAQQLLEEENIRSQGLRSAAAFMTKAEAVYLLYTLQVTGSAQ